MLFQDYATFSLIVLLTLHFIVEFARRLFFSGQFFAPKQKLCSKLSRVFRDNATPIFPRTSQPTEVDEISLRLPVFTGEEVPNPHMYSEGIAARMRTALRSW